MVHEGTIIFVNSELLMNEQGFNALKEYLRNNKPEKYTKFSGISAKKLKTEVLTLSIGEYPGTAGYFTVLAGYCCMTLETLKKIVGIYD